MAKIVVCPDSFKGSLSAREVALIIKDELIKIYPQPEIITLPLADGGEGTAEILKREFPLIESIEVHDALMKPLKTFYMSDTSGKRCVIESAAIIGLPLIDKMERNPLLTTSFGLGEAIKKVILKGYKDVTVSLGGSATCDCGMGMLKALGFKFLDTAGLNLEGRGCDMVHVASIADDNLQPDINKIKFRVICDVDNHLYGKFGAAYIFAPQKGAKPVDLPILDSGLQNLSKVLNKYGYGDWENVNSKGSGAAGGLGYAFQSVLKATPMRGVDYILDLLEFNTVLDNADLIITGEGKIDKQSLMGKVVGGVLGRSREKEVPLIAIVGRAENKEFLRGNNIQEIYEIRDISKSEEENMEKNIARKNLRETVKIMSKSNIFKQILH